VAIFIHIPRTAGTAVCHQFNLANYHATARQRRLRLGEEAWNNGFKFTIVRNPWQQVHSFYTLHTRQSKWREFDGGFEAWIDRGLPTHWKEVDHYADDPMDQWDYITDGEDNIIVDMIIKFEEIGSRMPLLCEHLGCQPQGLRPHHGTGAKWDHHTVYNEHTREVIAARYPKFIQHFGYSF